MRPLRRIFSISAADLQTIAIRINDYLPCRRLASICGRSVRHFVHRQVPINCKQPPLAW